MTAVSFVSFCLVELPAMRHVPRLVRAIRGLADVPTVNLPA